MINDSNYNDDDGEKYQSSQKLQKFVTIAVINITEGQDVELRLKLKPTFFDMRKKLAA